MYLPYLLLILDGIFFLSILYFILEARRENEYRAAKRSSYIAGVLIILPLFILFLPSFNIPIAFLFGVFLIYSALCLLPAKERYSELLGTKAFIKREPAQIDERDIPFARHRCLKPGTDIYQIYYKEHPEKEQPDADRRDKGLLGEIGSIDGCFQPLVPMMKTTFSLPLFLGNHAVANPEGKAFVGLSTEDITKLVKNYALHLGADLVGVCKVNPLWVYSHRGEIHYENWEDWGREISEVPPYAVVFCTEMDKGHVDTAPHTPSLAESGANYAKGAYISTLLANWFAHMGYRGVAEHNRHYNLVLPPLAVDAGLGEIGRLGYLIAPKFGPRVRIFATLTDMPLVSDKPISLGVDEFCRKCKKCALACPSKSIPLGEKTIYNGTEKWKLNEDTCFDYWSKVGTDCCVCMAICPFSRPNTLIHKGIRWCVARSRLAQLTFTYIDNFLYGKKWHSKTPPSWINFAEH